MEHIFVSFFFTKYGGDYGYACTVLEYDNSINSMTEINDLENIIKEKYEFDELALLNFKRMEGENVD